MQFICVDPNNQQILDPVAFPTFTIPTNLVADDKPMPTQLNLRPATPTDVPQILQFIETSPPTRREPDAVQTTEADLFATDSAQPKRFDCIIAELTDADATTPAGFALYFYNYSPGAATPASISKTSTSTQSIAGRESAKPSLARVAAIAVAEGCPRYEWAVLDWNQPSIDFYHSLGAVMKSEWKGHASHRRSPHRPRRAKQIVSRPR